MYSIFYITLVSTSIFKLWYYNLGSFHAHPLFISSFCKNMPRKDKNINLQNYESVHSATDDSIARVAISENGQIIYASDSFCDLSHIKPAHLKSTDISSIIRFSKASQTFNNIEAGIQKVKINGHEESFDFHFDWLTTPDNQRYLVGSQALKKKPTKKDLKAFEAIILGHAKQNNTQQNTSITDTTDVAHFLEMSGDLMLVIDKSGTILRTNNVFTTLFSFNSKKSAPMNFSALFDDHETPDINQKDVAFNAQMHSKDGQERWIAWRFDQAGDLIYARGHDVTAIKTQERALERREKQLTEAESIGRMGHWYWKIGQEELEWSQEIYRIFGVDKNDKRPTLLGLNDMVHKNDVGRVNQMFQRAIIEEKDYDMEFRIIQHGGDVRFIRCEGRCEKDDTGEIVALYGIMQDMTERMLAERKLTEAKDAAERAYAAKSQFLANMSHELRTPLNAIIGFSEMMQRQLLGPIGTEKYLEYIGGIRESGEHLLDLITDILDMSKIEAGKYELDLEELNLKKTINMALHMMQSRAMESGVKISAQNICDDDFRIIADRRAFMQIMLNLLSNAVKFSNDGGNIYVETHEREDYLSLKIIDEGIGIPSNKLAQITRPFEQVSCSYTRDHEGSGLGLAITKELAEIHGGALRIESKVGTGTTVTVRLPYDAFKATQNKNA